MYVSNYCQRILQINNISFIFYYLFFYLKFFLSNKKKVPKSLLTIDISLLISSFLILPSFCIWSLISLQSGLSKKAILTYKILILRFNLSGNINFGSSGRWGGALTDFTVLSLSGSFRGSIFLFGDLNRRLKNLFKIKQIKEILDCKFI